MGLWYTAWWLTFSDSLPPASLLRSHNLSKQCHRLSNIGDYLATFYIQNSWVPMAFCDYYYIALWWPKVGGLKDYGYSVVERCTVEYQAAGSHSQFYRSHGLSEFESLGGLYTQQGLGGNLKWSTGSCFEGFSPQPMVVFSEALETLGDGTELEE